MSIIHTFKPLALNESHFDVAHADDAAQEHDIAYAKHAKTQPELADMHWEAAKHWNNAARAHDVGQPTEAEKHTNKAAAVEDKIRKHKLKHGMSLSEGKENYLHDSTPGRRDTQDNRIKYTTGDKKGTYAVTHSGKKYKLDAKALNHVMPKVGSVLDVTKHTLMEDDAKKASVKYHTDLAAAHSRKFYETQPSGDDVVGRAHALAHNAHRNAAAAYKKDDPEAKNLTLDAVKASAKANAMSPLKENVLTTKERDALKGSQYALPSKKKYPIENKSHAVNAKARAKQQLDSGRLTHAEYDEIVSKADRVLGESDS